VNLHPVLEDGSCQVNETFSIVKHPGGRLVWAWG